MIFNTQKSNQPAASAQLEAHKIESMGENQL